MLRLQPVLICLIAVFFGNCESSVIDFFQHKNFSYHFYGAGQLPNAVSCQNLAHWMVNKVSSIRTSECVNLFSQADCQGLPYELPPGEYPQLGREINDKSVSFRACYNRLSTHLVRENRIQLYLNDSYKFLMVDEIIQPECNTLYPTLWDATSSLVTPKCVVLFSNTSCSGGDTFQVVGSAPSLPGFQKKLKSFRPCTVIEESEGRIDFYDHTNYIHHLYQTEDIPGPSSCQTMPYWMSEKVSSLWTRKCVHLFSEEDCQGEMYELPPGGHPDLKSFDDRAVSYRACDTSDQLIPGRENVTEYRIKLYSRENFTNLLLDQKISPRCETLHSSLFDSTESVKSPVCVVLYSSVGCRGGYAKRLRENKNVSKMPRELRLKSFRPCDPTSLFGEPQISGKIIKFEINSNEAEMQRRTRTGFTLMGQQGEYKNDGSATVTERYTARKSLSDRIEVDLVQSLSSVQDLSVSNSATKDFTQGFRTSMNKGFRKSKQQGISEGRRGVHEQGESDGKTEGDSENVSTSDSRNANSGFQQFGITGGKTQTKSSEHSQGQTSQTSENHHETVTKERSSTKNQEYTDETNALEEEGKNMEQRISDALSKSYSNSQTKSLSSTSRIVSEESKEFTVEKTISVPPCTDYNITSYVKTTNDFPIQYSVYVEITGKFGDEPGGLAMISSELQQRLGGLEIVGVIDEHTVLARGNASMLVDFSWYSVWNAKGKPIEGCHNGVDQLQENKVEIEFFGEPHFRGPIHREKITGACQKLPESAQNRVQSVRTAECVILFANENCDMVDLSEPRNIGYTLNISNVQGATLPYFENSTRSYQFCGSYESQAKGRNQKRVQFYSNVTNSAPITVAPLTKSCRNVPSKARGKVSSLVANQCVQLFSERNCRGRPFTVRPHSALRLSNYVGGMTESFKACANLPGGDLFFEHTHVQLYDDYEQLNGELLFDEPLKESCTTTPEDVWDKIVSINSNVCMMMYSKPYCQGYSAEISGGISLPSHYNFLKSFSPCWPDTTADIDGDEHENEHGHVPVPAAENGPGSGIQLEPGNYHGLENQHEPETWPQPKNNSEPEPEPEHEFEPKQQNNNLPKIKNVSDEAQDKTEIENTSVENKIESRENDIDTYDFMIY